MQIDSALSFLGVSVLCFVLYHILRVCWYSGIAIYNGKQTRPFSSMVNSPEATLLIVGDSTSFGTGASCSENSLAGRLGADFPAWSITNASQNALSLSGLVSKLQQMPDKSYDFLMIHIGGIDTISLTPIENIQKRAAIALQEARRVARRRVFLISVNNAGAAPMYQFPLSVLFKWRSRRVSTILNEVALQNDVTHIPLFREPDADPLLQSSQNLFASDGTHPNDAGYAYWYDIIKRGILPFIGRSM